jgi:hypothetical protein
MAASMERRQAPRIMLGGRPEARTQDDHPVGLVDLSTGGARLTSRTELHPGTALTLQLPRGLGGGALGARVVWTAAYGSVQTLEAGRHRLYQSGVAFVSLTPGQRAILEEVVAQVQRGRGADQEPK